MTLEFTRLSQLTGDAKYFDAVQRVTDMFERHQNETFISGLFPRSIDPVDECFDHDGTFTFGAGADSLYEYFPKQHMLLGGAVDQYQHLYERAIEAGKKHLFFRPLNPQGQDILISGTVIANSAGDTRLVPEGEHLACFVGGMVGIGSQIFNRPKELDIARKLVDDCIWAYDCMPSGIMPEIFSVRPCTDSNDCKWSEKKWVKAIVDERMVHAATERLQETKLYPSQIIREEGLPKGCTAIKDKRYLLRFVFTPPPACSS